MNLKKLISIASVAVVLVLGTLIATSTSSNQNAEVFNPIAGELVAADAPAVGGNAVDVGLYGTNVYELSLP
ncbi:MAG: hypothetical protein RL038_748, partial [Actinomycetota bacterium]